MQLDISESLYYCIQVDVKEGKGPWLKTSSKLPLISALEGIVREGATDARGPRVNAECLRKVVMERNTMLGTRSRVVSIQASDISVVCGSSANWHGSRWVDFGAQRFVLSMGISESHAPATQNYTQSQVATAEEMPELVDIPYSSVEKADVKVLAASGTTIVTLSLSQRPPALLEIFNSENDDKTVVLKFPAAEFAQVMMAAPNVASVLQQAGIPVGAACRVKAKSARPPMNEEHTADLSQPDRPRKVSM